MNETNEDTLNGFYRTAFWWMMGLGASGIAGALILAISLNVAVGKLQVEIANLSKNYEQVASSFATAIANQYSATTALADKRTAEARMEKMEKDIDALESAENVNKLWHAKYEDILDRLKTEKKNG